MKYFFDTEFHEDGRIIHPISFAMVADDGRELYMEFKHDFLPLNSFVKEHVVPNLLWEQKDRLYAYGKEGRDRLTEFIGKDRKPEFWAYFASYDWIVLCQMFGLMVDLPSHYPMFCNDVQQEFWRQGCPKGVKPDKPKNAHNALADARWTREFHSRLTSRAESLTLRKVTRK